MWTAPLLLERPSDFALQVEIVRVSRIIAGLALALGITFCFAFFVALGSPGAASKI